MRSRSPLPSTHRRSSFHSLRSNRRISELRAPVEEQQDQRPVAFLRQGVVGERLQELIPVTGFQLLGWPFGQRGHLNGDPLDRGAATLRGRRTAGTRRYDHSRDSLDRNAAYTVAAYLA